MSDLDRYDCIDRALDLKKLRNTAERLHSYEHVGRFQRHRLESYVIKLESC